jgi:hypothetical protein
VRKLSRKFELAAAFRYMRGRWSALIRCFDDGRLALDNNPAERAFRGIAIGRKNWGSRSRPAEMATRRWPTPSTSAWPRCLGSTVIEDFAFEDLIHLHNIPNLTSFADVLSHTTDFGSYSVITVDAAQNIWIMGQTSATFQESHFSFA